MTPESAAGIDGENGPSAIHKGVACKFVPIAETTSPVATTPIAIVPPPASHRQDDLSNPQRQQKSNPTEVTGSFVICPVHPIVAKPKYKHANIAKYSPASVARKQDSRW